MDELTSIREMVREAIQPHTDHGSAMDSGGGAASVDLWFWSGGTEYALTIRKVRSKPAAPKASSGEDA